VIERRAEAIWHGDTLGARVTRAALAPLSLMFAGAARVRSLLYDTGCLPTKRAPLPVISVGNLRVGGSGKTPTVMWLVDRLLSLGARPVVAMRGYGAGRSGELLWLEAGGPGFAAGRRAVSELGFRIVELARTGGEPGLSDEALLVASRSGVAVAVTPNRIAAAQAACAAGADVLVLDDGFQYRRLHRDLDIVLTQHSESVACVLPAGPLREPWRALRRAQVVMAPDVIVAPGTARVVSARAQPVGWVNRVAATERVAALDSWRGREAIAVAGIARPGRFFDMLGQCGVRVREHRVFRDHHRYTREEWADICRCVRAGEWVVTTEKDLVKLQPLAGADARLGALRVEMVIEPEADVVRLVRAAVPRLDARQGGPHDR
jgi:tetraacyldisaccharide 4'-kinase